MEYLHCIIGYLAINAVILGLIIDVMCRDGTSSEDEEEVIGVAGFTLLFGLPVLVGYIPVAIYEIKKGKYR